MTRDPVLVADDEEGIRTFIGAVLEGEGLRVTLAADGDQAAALMDRRSFHLLITDLKMPGLDGMALLAKARNEQPEMEVIILTAHGTVDTAVEAMKQGAFDYLSKPLESPDALRVLVRRALERRNLRAHQQAGAPTAPTTTESRDPAMAAVEVQLAQVAPTDATVLLLGESGVGKEVAARRIHAASRRQGGPFVALNCAALNANLLSSELFGHERGAFTGAASRRRGRFELAHGGTLFMDEVGELDPGIQAKLLRVLQEQSFERLGGTRTIDVDVRVIAATNRDLDAMVADGTFRADLYHRLAVFPIELPPLRERRRDIAPLAQILLREVARRVGRPRLQLSAEAVEALEAHDWPGNVRELQNALERAAILTEGDRIEPSALHLRRKSSGAVSVAFDGTLRDLEREAIRRALRATGGHRKRAAERLGIGLRTLYAKLREFDL